MDDNYSEEFEEPIDFENEGVFSNSINASAEH